MQTFATPHHSLAHRDQELGSIRSDRDEQVGSLRRRLGETAEQLDGARANLRELLAERSQVLQQVRALCGTRVWMRPLARAIT